MSAAVTVRRAELTLEVEFPDGERPVLGGRWPKEVTGLLVTWERGTAVDSSLAWHWFPMQATTLTARGPGGSWRYGSLGRDGSAPQWVRDAVAAHRPEDTP